MADRISLLLTLPTLVWGHMLQGALGYTAPHFAGSAWIPAVFGSAEFAYGGWPFIQGAVREIRERIPGMMTLIALVISVAFTFSLAVSFGFPGMPLWEELATLVAIMLLGHWIEMRSITQAQGALKELAKLLPNEAPRIVGDRLETVPISVLRDGDIVLIRPGARVPADGVVIEGSSSVDESMLTGESRSVEKKSGDTVIAGTVNAAGSLRVKVTGTGERTALAGIMRLVEQAQRSRSRAQALADRADPHHCRCGRRHCDPGGLVDCSTSQPRVRGRAHGHGARDRVPARAWSGRSARHRDLHDDWRAQRAPRPRPSRTGGGA